MEIKTRVPGKIEEIFVKVGDSVKMKDRLFSMEAMKMIQDVACPTDGVVKEILISSGDRVKSGSVAMKVE